MGRRLERLTPDTLADLPAEVRRDLTWECDPVAAARAEPAEAEERKRDWLSGVLLEWGSCGRVAYHDDDPAGFIVYAPSAYLPGSGSFPTAPVSDDAVQMATAVVFDGHRGGGLGRALVQVMARDLVRRGGVRAVEAIAQVGARVGDQAGDQAGDPVEDPVGAQGPVCGPVPAEFLQRVGFTTLRPHPRNPRLRLELRSLVSWLDEVGTAWERLRDVVRTRGRPVPASREAGLTDGRP